MELLLQIVNIGVALFMILVVLVQGGNQGGIGAALGGGNSSSAFGSTGATSFLGKLTYGAAAIFMVTTIMLTVYQGHTGDVGLTEALEKKATTGETATPAETTTPPATEEAAPATEPEAESDQ